MNSTVDSIHCSLHWQGLRNKFVNIEISALKSTLTNWMSYLRIIMNSTVGSIYYAPHWGGLTREFVNIEICVVRSSVPNWISSTEKDLTFEYMHFWTSVLYLQYIDQKKDTWRFYTQLLDFLCKSAF